MKKVAVYNQRGEKEKDLKLPGFFEEPMNRDLLWQAVTVYRANKRRGTAHTKTRDEVSGGGRKPWPQKGTGRARHGSTRSPLWVGGGTAFGPRKDKKYKKKLPKKMRRKALAVALASKLRDDSLVVLNQVDLDKPKTKLANALVKKIREKADRKEGTVLIVLEEKNEDVFRAVKNLPDTVVTTARIVNALHILRFKNLFITEKAIEYLKKRLS